MGLPLEAHFKTSERNRDLGRAGPGDRSVGMQRTSAGSVQLHARISFCVIHGRGSRVARARGRKEQATWPLALPACSQMAKDRLLRVAVQSHATDLMTRVLV